MGHGSQVEGDSVTKLEIVWNRRSSVTGPHTVVILPDLSTTDAMIEVPFRPWNPAHNTSCQNKEKIYAFKVHSSGKVSKCPKLAFWLIALAK